MLNWNRSQSSWLHRRNLGRRAELRAQVRLEEGARGLEGFTWLYLSCGSRGTHRQGSASECWQLWRLWSLRSRGEAFGRHLEWGRVGTEGTGSVGCVCQCGGRRARPTWHPPPGRAITESRAPAPSPPPVGDRATPRGRGSRSGSLASSLPAAHSARCTPLCPGPLGAGQRRVSCLGGSGVPVQLSGADAGGCPLCHSWTAAWGGDKGAGGPPTPTHPCCRGGAGHTARHRHPSLVSPPL